MCKIWNLWRQHPVALSHGGFLLRLTDPVPCLMAQVVAIVCLAVFWLVYSRLLLPINDKMKQVRLHCTSYVPFLLLLQEPLSVRQSRIRAHAKHTSSSVSSNVGIGMQHAEHECIDLSEHQSKKMNGGSP